MKSRMIILWYSKSKKKYEWTNFPLILSGKLIRLHLNIDITWFIIIRRWGLTRNRAGARSSQVPEDQYMNIMHYKVRKSFIEIILI